MPRRLNCNRLAVLPLHKIFGATDSKLKIIIEFFVLHLYADGTMTENRRFDTSASKNVLYTHVFLDLFKRKIIHICKHAILEYR